jgi:hypothetical protein
MKYLFVNTIAPVIKLYGFDWRPYPVTTVNGGWAINIGKNQNWVATFIEDHSPHPQHVLMMTLYDGDFAADAFLVKFEFGDDGEVRIIDECNDIDTSTFPTYDGLVDPEFGITLEYKVPLEFII